MQKERSEWFMKGEHIVVRQQSPNMNFPFLHFWLGDIHYDSKHCNRQKVKEHLDSMYKAGALIYINGDLVDAMGGVDDRRTTSGDIDDEFDGENYFDTIVKKTADFLRPYKDRIVLINRGNHEYSVKRRNETDVIKRIVENLNGEDYDDVTIKQKRLNRIFIGDYNGFVEHSISQRSRPGANGSSANIMTYYDHGSGGGAPVTAGTIKMARRAEYIEADIFVTSHIHNAIAVPKSKMFVDYSGNIKVRETIHVQLGSYDPSMKSYYGKKGGFKPALPSSYYIEMCLKRLYTKPKSLFVSFIERRIN